MKSTSRMIERFDKYVAILMDYPDGTIGPRAFYDEKRYLNGVNVLGRDGMVYHIPKDDMSKEQKKFMSDNVDPDGRLGTITIVSNKYLLPFGGIDMLFPEPTMPEFHEPQYAAAINACIGHGKRGKRLTGGQVPPFPYDLFDDNEISA